MTSGKMKTDFLSTIEPFLINKTNFQLSKRIKDVSSLRPDTGNDVLLILGDGWNVIDDLEEFLKFGISFDLMVGNYGPKIVPKGWKIHHYIAGDSHTKEMQDVARSLADGTLRHCWNSNGALKSVAYDEFDIRWARNSSKPWNGTTTNLGIKIGIALGYMKIILAGCPMDGGGNWYTKTLDHDDIKRYKDHRAHLWKWTEIASRPVACFIRSMSGNTADLLGKPDDEWLNN